jgi:Ni/Fe-hydrogenase subunit HybB-like protein
VVAGAFTALTGVLLVADLKQPGRFHYILTRPNWGSWLTRGAVILAGFAALTAAWFVAGLLDASGAIEVLAAPTALLAAATAGYTAYLFAQCEGRDLWQTPLLLPMLLAQAVTAGAAAFTVADVFVTLPQPDAVRWALLGGVLGTGGLIAVELAARSTRHVELALAAMTRGPFAGRFRLGVVAGVLVPAVLVILALAGVAPTGLAAIAGLVALAGLAAYEDAFVRAGQSVPLS